MRCSRRSVTSRCTSSCTRSPARHLPSSRGQTRSGCSRVRYVTVCNGLVVLTNTERKARYQERRKAGGVPVPPASGPESQERSRRTAGRPSARVGRSSGHVSVAGRVARRFTLERSTPRHAACSGAGSALALVSVERHAPPVPWWAAIAFPMSPAHATPAHRLVADVDADSNRLPSGAPSGIPAVCRVPRA